MSSLLEGLNAAQKEAVTTTEGYVRVIAGAGSGKTRALSHRFAYLVNELGIMPGNILCVTFTNKSAAEMRSRIHTLTGDNDTGYINTFHGFCVGILQEDSHAIGYPSAFLVLDNADIDSMLKTVYEERGLTLRDMTFSAARDMIEIQKTLKKPDYYLDLVAASQDTLMEKYLSATEKNDIIFYGYLLQQKKCFGVDYNDLIILSLHIFHEYEDIRLKWQKRLEYIMIDEFQDIDDLQIRLMRVLCAYHKNLFVVGDPDQTIYTWRGANVKYLLDFDVEFQGTHTIMMMQNYRSRPEILNCANSLIRRNKTRMEKDLLPTLDTGEMVVCHHAKNAAQEAEYIANTVEELVSAGKQYREMTVLYRAHYVTRAVEEMLIRKKIPYSIYSGVQFFEREEIKDALSYLRMVAYLDDLSFQRVVNKPKRNLGERRMNLLKQYAAQHECSLYEALKQNLEDDIMKGTKAGEFVNLIERFHSTYSGRPVSDVLTALLDESGYELMRRTEGSSERLDNLSELKQSVYEYEVSCGEETTLESYISHVALFTNRDLEERHDRVRLMTVHAAKGLEFDTVFLCGMNEGVFPSRRVRTLAGMEEERRLAFVAVTRAKNRLIISEAEGYNLDNTARYPSRFIFDMGMDNLRFEPDADDALMESARQAISQSEAQLVLEEGMTFFSVGTRVVHGVFGQGVILEADNEKMSYVIQFDGMVTPRSISSKVKLEQII